MTVPSDKPELRDRIAAAAKAKVARRAWSPQPVRRYVTNYQNPAEPEGNQ